MHFHMDYSMVLSVISFALCCLLIARHLIRSNTTTALPTNWPILGMLPALLSQVSRVHDWITDIFLFLGTGNFLFRGPWFCNMDTLLTVDPANVRHIVTAYFDNFPKGSDYKNIFDVLGDGIFNVDGEQWKEQRRVAMSFLHSKKFHLFQVRTSTKKIKAGLIPILDRASKEGMVLDLQDLFKRFTFDSICKLVTGFDLELLSHKLPELPISKAMDDIEEQLFFRHVMPEFMWKLQRAIGFGREKKFSDGWKHVQASIDDFIELKRKELKKSGESIQVDEEEPDLLTSYMTLEKNDMLSVNCKDDKFLRDMILNFIVAGRDTNASALTWLFWNLSRHPLVVSKIREEISAAKRDGILETSEFIDKMVYLHGAICESLRLHPPTPLQHKRSIKPDRLPSGHNVQANARIIWDLYAMARMPWIWGKDCAEFKPERWISDKGTIKYEPSYKFNTFNSGPRTCLGKNFTFTQMKLVAATIIQNFQIHVEEGQDVRPCVSVILHMKHGLKARVSRISDRY